MALTAGARLGPYEIVAPLGAGGMGEVWHARDTRLERDVAIKALPDGFAQDPDRLARFEREARLLASLNHPNVAGIHGLEDVEGHRYLVLEFVPGETLAARLARGALPLDEAIEVCRQVAAGVEAAHEAGVVHRDLKPGNVMLTGEGAVKVLDFGLAKSGAPERTGSDPSLTASPTRTAAATTAGVILGTAAYMSPEQARGRAMDKRSDIWSFGCVLYECLTGRQAFRGETVSDTIAAILRSEADLGALPAGTPAALRELLARCLCKDPRERLRDIGEARVRLGAIRADEAPAPATPRARRGGVPAWLAVGGALALAALAVALALRLAPRAAPAPVRRLELAAEDVGVAWFRAPRLSPDGRQLAYVARGRLMLRDLAELEPRRLADVQGMATLCWSPDSKEIAYSDRKKLWKVAVSGGTPVALCDLPGTGVTIGITWSARGVIALSAWRGGIYTVPAAGGVATPLVDIDPARVVDFHNPCWLPNGDLMYVVHATAFNDTANAAHHDLEVFAGGRRIGVPMTVGDAAEPIVTASGKLLFLRRGTNAGIWAVAYDLGARRPIGEPRLVAADAASVSASDDGSLLYVRGQPERKVGELVWVDRAGKVLGSTGPAYPGLASVELSPDRRRAAFTTELDGRQVVWVRDLARGLDTRITFSSTDDLSPHWLGANRLSFEEIDPADEMHTRIVVVNADGSGGRAVLAGPAGSSMQEAFLTPDGKTALRVIDERGHGRMLRADVRPDGTLGPPEPFLTFTPDPDVSGIGLGSSGVGLAPSGRMVAYCTGEEQSELFLARFPGGEGPWQVSADGGQQPRWTIGAKTLVYVAGSDPSRRSLVEVAVDETRDPPIGRSTRLFDFEAAGVGPTGRVYYDVDAGGQRFLVAREAPGSSKAVASMVLVENWEREAAGK